MNGVAGLAGWRWLFIICGIIVSLSKRLGMTSNVAQTMPLGLLTFFLLPDFPENTKTWYLTDDEKALARERVVRNGQLTLLPTTDPAHSDRCGQNDWQDRCCCHQGILEKLEILASSPVQHLLFAGSGHRPQFWSLS
jgi:hypothetical protein